MLQEHIKKPLAEELLFGRLTGGGTVRINLVDGKLAFTYPTPALPPKAKEEEAGDDDRGPDGPSGGPDGPAAGPEGGAKVPETVP